MTDCKRCLGWDFVNQKADVPLAGWDWVLSRVALRGKEITLEDLDGVLTVLDVLGGTKESIEAVKALRWRLEATEV